MRAPEPDLRAFSNGYFYTSGPVTLDVIGLTAQVFGLFARTSDCSNARLQVCRSAFALATQRFDRLDPLLTVAATYAARKPNLCLLLAFVDGTATFSILRLRTTPDCLLHESTPVRLLRRGFRCPAPVRKSR
ncbi:hypothetical protein Poly51_62120 [Rubripirellula tenax]|uniref:Uncharacterized protein n=1 Tax=Rubripirellula tenax TaxID=2528015 RepID=A0A5C6E4E0_9BACT|nr:hypothetical protein [Rubripirellula tenax]TWU43690.1 hypothetical protein Poly51_62120 [Rubripirellula tenax]